MEQLDYNLLFRWFVGLSMTPVWDVTVFTKNRDRLLEGEIAAKFLAAVLARPELAGSPRARSRAGPAPLRPRLAGMSHRRAERGLPSR